MDQEQAFSKKVTTVMFLMSLQVLLIHNNNTMVYGLNQGLSSFAEGFIKLFSFDLGSQAVPVFFLLSGGLFYRFDLREGWGTLRKKLGRRIFSTLVPYLLWNILYTGIYLVLPQTIAWLRTGTSPGIDFLWKLLGGVFLADYCFVFWYLRNLMVLMLLSPLILVLLRKKYLCLAVTALWGLAAARNRNLTDWLYSSSLFYYLLGAWLMQYRRDFFLKQRSGLWLLVVGILVLLRFFNLIPEILASAVGMAMIPMTWMGLKELDFIANTPFCHQSFVIYCLHPLVVSFWRRLFAIVYGGRLPLQVWVVGSYLISAVLSVGTLYILCSHVLPLCPGAFHLLSGGRGKRP